MDTQKIIAEITKEVRENFKNEGSGHDWWHIYRVLKMAEHIGQQEGANMFVVCLGALLHDVADWKFHDGDETVGPKLAREMLTKYQVSEEVIKQVCEVIEKISFKGAGVSMEMPTIEGKVVQDADRLDAMGAIGVCRAFTYGGYKNRPMYDPNKKPIEHQSKEEYLKDNSSTINHFYSKLLLLKDRINTQTAKKIAEERHKFMEIFLDRFLQEWDGKI